jgi:hypothetical protein
MLSFGDIPAELYRWFLLAYGVTAAGRIAAEVYKQIAVLGTAWYDVPTVAFAVLEQGFIQHTLLSFSAAEVLNMVFGALYKQKIRRQTRDERDRAWREWLWRKAEAEAKGEPFNEPSPDEQPMESKR